MARNPVRYITGKDGNAYVMRPIQPTDAASVVRGYAALSDREKWFRMLHAVPALSTEFVRAMCAPDAASEACLVIEGRGALAQELIGGARVADLGAGRDAEYSVSMRPEGAGLGLARQALDAFIEIARARGCRSVWGLVARNNTAMLGLADRLGFKREPCPGDATLVTTRLCF